MDMSNPVDCREVFGDAHSKQPNQSDLTLFRQEIDVTICIK